MAYLEPSWTSPMELLCENSWHLKTVNSFRNKAPSYIFDWVLNTPHILYWYWMKFFCSYREEKGGEERILFIFVRGWVVNLLHTMFFKRINDMIFKLRIFIKSTSSKTDATKNVFCYFHLTRLCMSFNWNTSPVEC